MAESKYAKFLPASNGSYTQIPPAKIAAWIENNFEFKTRKNGTEYCICNPLDRDDTGFNFNINPEKGNCHSWRSDEWAGPANPKTNKRNCSFVKFVRLYRKCGYREALADILGSGVNLSTYFQFNNRLSAAAVPEILVDLPIGVTPLTSDTTDTQGQIVLRWLRSRGYTNERIELAELQHLGLEVYWPYYEFDALVYWQSRSRINKVFRFPSTHIYGPTGEIIGTTAGSKGDFLYGFDEVEHAEYLIITEAIFGQNTLGEQAVASGGAALTPEQVKKIRLLGPRKGIILSPDNDAPGIKSIISNHKELAPLGLPVLYSIPPKVAYTNSDGKTKYTKDWNEFVTHLKMPNAEVRAIHDRSIKAWNLRSHSQLLGMINVNR